ncbi:MAG TPA: hypothetical protein GX724_06450 [Fibrobacter sp.]|nr:hypothetical protein [Fibrobacter sp.]
MNKLLFFALFIFLTSCTTNVSDEDSSGIVDVDQNYIEKNWVDLIIDFNPRSSDELSYGRIVSFLKPNSKGSLDTFTVTTSVNDKLFMKEDKFIFIGGGTNEACLIKTENLDLAEHDMASENRDTIFLNYGKSKLMDYIPYQEIPPINTSLLKKTLSVIDSKRNFVLSDTIISSYTFEAKNFLDGIKFEEYYFFVEYTVDYCAGGDIIMYPESVKRKMYYLINTGRDLPRDTTINWTLVYTDQYGRSDSLEMKTLFK